MTNADHDDDRDSDANNDPGQTHDSKPIVDPTATAHTAGEDQVAENRENEPPG